MFNEHTEETSNVELVTEKRTRLFSANRVMNRKRVPCKVLNAKKLAHNVIVMAVNLKGNE